MSVAAARRVASRLDPGDPPTDAELVLALAPGCPGREAAFGALVGRYGPMVLGACRGVLADAHAAEDAFQAVFLVLARKFEGVRPPGSVGGWLYGVAVRTARKAKTAAARRQRREMTATELANPGSPEAVGSELDRAELRQLIDDELAALPDMHRAAVVLCDLRGQTRTEAAAELGRAEGTVASWLARGRKALAARLSRRGVVLPAAGLGAVVTGAPVSAELSAAAVGNVLGRAVPDSVLALAEGVMRSLSTVPAKFTAALLAAGALLAAVATATAWHTDPGAPPGAPPAVNAVPPADPKPGPDATGFVDHVGPVHSVAYAPDGRRFVSAGTGGAVVWDAATRKALYRVETAEFARFSDDGKSFFYLTKDEYHIADAATGNSRQKFPRAMPKARGDGARWAAISGDGLARAEFDGLVHAVTNYPIAGATPPLNDQGTPARGAGPVVPEFGRGGAFVPGGIDRFAGTHALTAGAKELACLTLWKLHEGDRIGTIARPKWGVQAFAWSPDGAHVAVAFPDCVRVYLTDPKVIAGAEPPADDQGPFKRTHNLDVRGATAVAWSPDRKRLAVAFASDPRWSVVDPNVRKVAVVLFDLATGREVSEVAGFADNLPVASLAFRPDGKELLCGAGFPPGGGPGAGAPQPARDARGLRVIPLVEAAGPAAPAWKEQFSLETAGWLPGSVGYSLDGDTLFAGGSGGAVRAYDVKTRKELWKYESDGRFAAVAVSGSVMLGTRTTSAVVVTGKGGVKLLDPKTGKVLETFDEKGAEPVAAAAFPERGLANFDGGGFAGTECKVVFGSPSGYAVKSWFRTPDGKSGPPGTINLSVLPAGGKPADEYAVPLSAGPGGRAVTIGPIDPKTQKNVLWLWGAGGGAGNFILDGHKAAVVCAAWSPDATMCATGDADGVVILWDADKAKEKWRLNLGGRVAALAISDDQKHVAAAVAKPDKGEPVHDEEVFVCPLAGAPQKPEPVSRVRRKGAFAGFASVAFAPGGKSLAAAFCDFQQSNQWRLPRGAVRVFAPADGPAPR